MRSGGAPSAARTIGISVLQMKVLVSGIAACVAGIGGAMYALSLGSALPTNYSSLLGLVWLAILVTLGIRSSIAALLAGVSYTVLSGVVVAYLPTEFTQVTPILFGLGAVQVAKFPNGAMTENARQVLWAWDKLRGVSRPGPGPRDPGIRRHGRRPRCERRNRSQKQSAALGIGTGGHRRHRALRRSPRPVQCVTSTFRRERSSGSWAPTAPASPPSSA